MKFKKALLSLAIAAAGLGVISLAAPKAHALSGSDFNPGRIIDDSVFFNKDAMSVSDIQNFLYAKSGPCDTNRPTTDSRYQPPWTCLYQYRENIDTHVNNIGAPTTNPAGSITGAEIIYKAAQDYNISPKALIVLIQKESSLITDNWPWSNQYKTATGYGCPDTAACDSQYYGFFNQVYKAAFQFRRYATYPSEYNYKAGRNNNIGYNPNSGCGYQTVYIQNQATAGLYNYTPYVPNAAALNNLYGTGDGCSAYGNRNFWRLYNDWFGSTQGVAYQAAYAGQSAWPSISPGGTADAYFKYKNTGNSTWYDNTSLSSAPSGTLPVHLATGHPINRDSTFGTWGNRPNLNFSAVYEADGSTLSSSQHIVQPGQIVKFSFTFTAGSNVATGTYREYFQPVLEGSSDGAFSDPGTYLDVTVQGTYGITYITQGASPTLRPTEGVTSSISYKNTGNIAWYDDVSIYFAPGGTNPVHLATAHDINRSSIFGVDWGTAQNRPALTFAAVYKTDGVTPADDQHVVRAGQIAKFNVPLRTAAGQAAGSFTEYFQPILEGTPDGGFTALDSHIDPIVSTGVAGASTQGVQTYTMVPGETKALVPSFTNVGNTSWTSSTVYLKPDGSTNTSKFRSASWVSASKATTLNQSTVAAGATGTFNLSITAPAQAGSYEISFAPGNDADSYAKPNARYIIQVQQPTYSAAYAGQSAWPSLAPGGTADAFFKYKNTGNVAWYDNTSLSSAPSGTQPVHLSTSHPINRDSAFGAWGNRPGLNFSAVYEADGTTLASDQHVVQPGQIVKFAFTFTVSSSQPSGTYREYFQPIVEGTADGAINDPGTYLDVTVQ